MSRILNLRVGFGVKPTDLGTKAKNYNSLFSLLLLCAVCMLFSTHLSADEFGAVNDILSSGDKAGKKALGTIIVWLFGLALPIVCVASGAIMGYSQQKKKSEQEQNTTKIYVVTLISGIVGFFVFVIVSMIISRILFGDSNYIFGVINDFYRGAVN
ncbi:hypothetical protein [Helicobacter turcicus]|uniref:DUF4190 domain-containing protein n=1 Tax=Helicobacter turcicus TaxID=2867412 RepID=A0ABS7JP87_9HELI|nr:hypothetical protein [Helicobacter turcicus]MBX7491212.1 hypothetical protein [Helicobacter turcicus]MBX7546149.1 hypothetical protein [Helicobacter turcicus]